MKINSSKNFKVLLVAFWSSAFALPLASCADMPQSQDNIALGKTVTFNTKPNYSDTSDPDDSKQLTDGKYSSGTRVLDDNTTINSIWGQTSTVGWQRVSPVVITIDFGSVQPISGVSFSTGAGTAGVTWPTAIYMAVSDDNKTWHAAGDLVPLSRINGAPTENGYSAFRYVTHSLHRTGRYIAFAVMATPYIFADEIEVYKGDAAWINQPMQGEVISDLKEYANASLIRSATQRRLYDDISAIKKEIDVTHLSASQKSTFHTRLEKDANKVAQMPQLGRDFKTILPLDDTHRNILAVRGALLAAQGIAPLTVWKMHRYSWLPFLAKPSNTTKPKLSFSMLRNQFRSDDLLLTNASGKSQDVTLQLKNAPKNTQNGWMQFYSVAWTDTSQGTPVANALIPVQAKNSHYVINIPAGMTRRVWITIDSSKLPAGNYKSTFDITSGDQHATVPINLDVSKIAMNNPRLSLSTWDGVEGNGSYGITPQNRQAAIDLMRSHYVNTPWTNGRGIPLTKDSDFDAQGNLKSKLDFSTLDQWIAMWSGAERYMIFSNVPDNIGDAKMNTPEFKLRVGSWAKALSQHMMDLGLKPEQLGILLVDEPHQESQDTIVAAWANAIKAAAPALTLFSDPTWPRPDQTKTQDALTLMDILCPNLPIYNNGGAPVKKYFSDLRSEGKKLWFYQSSGPTWEFDPQLYFRYQAWHAFNAGAAGEAFWSFGDIGKAPTSWNGYSNTGVVYSPVYLDETTATDGINWDAAREGVEDYEELAMLQDVINASHDAAWKTQAQQTLDAATKAVTGIWNVSHYTTREGDPTLADTQLQKVKILLNQKVDTKQMNGRLR